MTHLIERFTEYLKKGKYNSATIAAYRQAIFVFYNHFREYPQSKFTDQLISEYLLDLKHKNSSKYDTIQTGKALKLFFEIIFGRKINVSVSENKDLVIDVLSKEEICTIFNSTKNQKHKLLLMLIYNSGLKINEVINLEVSDLNLKENTIKIRNKNANKNRILRLAPSINHLIEEYLQKYKPHNILFTGANDESHYSPRNIQMFFHKILEESGINKEATINTLRHSFAVHSLEMGIDLHLLQNLLGHSNIQTTKIYQQFVSQKLQNIKSPLEFIEN